MARVLRIIVLLLLSTSVVHAAGQFEYVGVESIQDGPVVTVEEMDSFVYLAESNDVETILVPSDTSALSSRFMFAADGVVYSTNASEYNTIKDYAEGQEAGFEYGKDFYHAQDLGIESFSRYSLFVDGWFQSVEDMEDAYASGFGDASFDELQPLFPQQVSRSEFENTLLPILVRATIQNELPSEEGNSHRFSLEDLGERRRSARQASRQTLSLPQLGIELPTPPYYGSEIYTAVERGTASVLRRMKAMDPTRRGYAASGRITGYSAGPIAYGLNGDQYKVGRVVVAEWDPDAAGVYFYLARLHGYDSFQAFRAEYEDLRVALQYGFLSLADAKESEDSGFRSAQDYYTAQDRGFDNGRDYDFAGRLQVDSDVYYDQYLPIINSLSQLRDENSTPNSGSSGTSPISYEDALVLYMFDRVPEGRVVSTSAMLSKTEDFMDDNPALENLISGLSRLEQRWLDNFIEEHEEAIEEVGDLRTEDGVFVGG